MTPRVIGLDLSITATGIADAVGDTYTVGGKATLGDLRLHYIADCVQDEIDCEVDLAVIEDLAVHGPGGGMAAAQVMGAVKLTLLTAGVPYALVAPSTLKKYATGKGTASKADMAVALFKRTGLELPDDNQVDAFLLRAAGLHALGHPLFDVPKAQSEALTKVQWPTIDGTVS